MIPIVQPTNLSLVLQMEVVQQCETVVPVAASVQPIYLLHEHDAVQVGRLVITSQLLQQISSVVESA